MISYHDLQKIDELRIIFFIKLHKYPSINTRMIIVIIRSWSSWRYLIINFFLLMMTYNFLIFIFKKNPKSWRYLLFLRESDSGKKIKTYILMKWSTTYHKLVSISSNVKILKILTIVNFIRVYDQDHLQFSIVSNLLFKILQLYSCQYLSIFSQISLFES